MAITIEPHGYTLLGAKNPIYNNADKSQIVVDCKFSHYEDLGITEDDGYLPFVAMLGDNEPHGAAIYKAAKAGDYGTVGDYVEPEKEEEEEEEDGGE